MSEIQWWNNDIDFSTNWQLFIENVESYSQERKKAESISENIQRKICYLEYTNPNEASCYAFMGSVLCYLFYENTTTESGRVWARQNGKKYIRMALKHRPQDEEFKVLSYTFDLIELAQIESNVKKFFDTTQRINKQCPAIESISDSLINNDFLRDWYNTAYYQALYKLSWEHDVDYNTPLKIEVATALKSSSFELAQLMALFMLADANFDSGNYPEAERYAILGKDRIENLMEYDRQNVSNFLWGLCWNIYGKCQEKSGDVDFAFTIYERGCQLGIPECMKELSRMYENGVGVERDLQKAHELYNRAETILATEKEEDTAIEAEDSNISSSSENTSIKTKKQQNVHTEMSEEGEKHNFKQIVFIVLGVIAVIVIGSWIGISVYYMSYGLDKSIYTELHQYNVKKIAQSKDYSDFEKFYRQVQKKVKRAQKVSEEYGEITYRQLYEYSKQIYFNAEYTDNAKREYVADFNEKFRTPNVAKLEKEKEKWEQYIVDHTISNYIAISPCYGYREDGLFFIDYRPKFHFEVSEFKGELSDASISFNVVNSNGSHYSGIQTWNLAKIKECNGHRGNYECFSRIDDEHFWNSHSVKVMINSITIGSLIIYANDIERMPTVVSEYLKHPNNLENEFAFIRKYVNKKYPSYSEFQKLTDNHVQQQLANEDSLCYSFMTNSFNKPSPSSK